MSDFHVERLDHVHVAVRDRAAAIRWYGDVLGLEKYHDHTEGGDARGPVVLSSDGGETHLALFETKEVKPGQIVAFRVKADTFLAFLDRLDRLELYALGRRVMRKDAADHGNSWSVYFCDPDGNPYEITTYDYSDVSSRLK